MKSNLFIIHLCSCLFMTGLIWFVQLVHYPLFILVSDFSFETYESSHQFRTSLVVIPAMITELLSALVLLYQGAFSSEKLLHRYFLLSLILLGVVWLSTFLIQVPLHSRLEQGFSATSIHSLVISNWIRTMAWTLRSVFLIIILRSKLSL